MTTIGDTKQTANLTLKEFKLFQEFIYEHAGIRMTEKKMPLIQNRLRKRLAAYGCSSYQEYYQIIANPKNKDEYQQCLNELTTNETYFFRHKNHWDYLIQQIVPTWKLNAPENSCFNFWSAASSTGEEPYSAAMALDSLFNSTKWTFSVDATDINEDVLNAARRGIYSDYSVQKLTKLCLKRYFTIDRENRRYIINNNIKSHVHFSRHNLLTPKTGTRYHVVFLRNVMIYFDDTSKKTVTKYILDRLHPGGYLILGGAESLSAYRECFDYIKPTIFRKR